MLVKNILRSVGPALIVAAVVLGPGSITTSTKVGAAFGYGPLWVLVCLLVLLVGTAALAAWLGATLDKTLCRELAARLGPWAGWVIGIAFFLIVAGFQSSNNMAVVAGIEPLLGEGVKYPKWAEIATLLCVNGIIVGILYLSKDLYRQIERIMKVFILAMVLAFIVNFFWAGPSFLGALKGLIPDLAPFRDPSQAILLMGLIATTYSVAGAFYQGYLVRERGWGPDDVKKGFMDSLVGMCVLVGVSAVILMTSAATFHGVVHPDGRGEDVRAAQECFWPALQLHLLLRVPRGGLQLVSRQRHDRRAYFRRWVGLGLDLARPIHASCHHRGAVCWYDRGHPGPHDRF